MNIGGRYITGDQVTEAKGEQMCQNIAEALVDSSQKQV